MSEKVAIIPSAVMRREELIVNVLRACAACGAPGFWHDTPGVNVGCYAPDKITMLGRDPVGTTCPQCGAGRDAVEPHGVVWFREWRVGLWPVVKALIKDAVRGFQLRRT